MTQTAQVPAPPADPTDAGKGETAAMLEKLPESWVVLHNVCVPGKRWSVDHLVIGPGGVTGLWSASYSGRVTVAGSTMWGGDHPRTRELMDIGEHAAAVAAVLGLDVTPAMCIHTADLPELEFTVREIDILAPYRLLPWFLEQTPHLLDMQVTAIAAADRHRLETGGLPHKQADAR